MNEALPTRRAIDSQAPRAMIRTLAWRTSAVVSLVVIVAICGCSPSMPARPILSEAELQARSEEHSRQSRESFRAAIERLMARTEERVAAATGDSRPVLNLLALSGGGDYGAFGAGFLVGWGSATDPQWKRPDFDAVSGVSTGGLLAPFAYIGTDEACRAVEDFYRNPHKGWVEERGLLFFLPQNPSFMMVDLLRRDVDLAFDRRRIEQMAEQSRNGKLLLVSATDLDFGLQRVWDVGREAETAAANGELDRIHRIMMASAAIPAIFPPVEIDGSLYADGGVTANVLVRLDPRSPDGLLRRWMQAHPGKPLPKIRYWVIVNNQLTQAPKTTQPKWPAIISPSLSTSIRSATIAEIRWLAAQADFVNATMNTDIEVRVVAIPNEWRPPAPGDFVKETMESLSDLGRKMGADPSSWRVWASPNDAQGTLNAPGPTVP